MRVRTSLSAFPFSLQVVAGTERGVKPLPAHWKLLWCWCFCSLFSSASLQSSCQPLRCYNEKIEAAEKYVGLLEKQTAILGTELSAWRVAQYSVSCPSSNGCFKVKTAPSLTAYNFPGKLVSELETVLKRATGGMLKCPIQLQSH